MRLLIVDDDYQIRNGMQNGIEWGKIGIAEVDTCANGMEALAAIEEKGADIIVADIQMPGMTGLELIKRVREFSGNIRVIFISAYSEFDYCRQALLMGANDYVLKPIQMDEFMEVIRKNVRALGEEKEQNFQYQKAVAEQIVRKIYEDETGVDLEQLREIIIRQAGFLKTDYFIVTLIRLGETLSAEKKSEAENILNDYMDGWMLPMARLDAGILCITPGNNSALMTVYLQNTVKQRLDKWNQIYEARYGNLEAGISCSHVFKEMKTGIFEAAEALERIFYLDNQHFFISNGIALKSEVPDVLTQELKKVITELSQRYEYAKGLEALLYFAEKAGDIPLKVVVFKRILENFYGKLCRECGWGAYWNRLSTELGFCSSAREYVMKIMDICDFHRKLSQNVSESAQDYSHTVRLAIEFMNLHYSEQITVGDVAETVKKSPNYLSSIFKKETGLSFTKYLNVLRLEQAKWLLLQTNRQISEIYEAVGYTDYIYFSQLFRKQFGCSASEIRSRMRDGK